MRKNLSILKLKKEGNAKMRKLTLIVVLSLVAMMATASMAFANHTSGATLPLTDSSYNAVSFMQQADGIQQNTYANMAASGGCQACHGWDNVQTNTRAVTRKSGPHGDYTTTSGKCITCHTIHTGAYGNTVRVAQNTKLLPGATVTAVCNYCHDLTGTPDAPYSTRYMDANAPKSAHYVEGATAGSGINAIMKADPYSTTANNAYKNLNMPGKEAGPNGALGDVIPGGDASTGGTQLINGTLFNQGEFATFDQGTKLFTCDSCHTPHAVAGSTVAPYWGETERTNVQTARLLKTKLLAGQVGNIANYGSAWCAGCHKGRLSMTGGGANNHPVNQAGLGYLTKATLDAAIASGDAFVNNGIDADESGAFDLTSDRDLAKTNAWYAMDSVDPIGGKDRVADQDALANDLDGYIDISFYDLQAPVVGAAGTGGPSCQQCHASARDVESSITDLSKATAGSNVYTGNPFTTFPHVSRTKSLLVEDGDDLCTNCHGLTLP